MKKTRGRYACGYKLDELSTTSAEEAIKHFNDCTNAFNNDLKSEFENILKEKVNRRFFSIAEENSKKEVCCDDHVCT